jgi:hypothetical protein
MSVTEDSDEVLTILTVPTPIVSGQNLDHRIIKIQSGESTNTREKDRTA